MDNVDAAPMIFPIGQRYRHQDWPLKNIPIIEAPRRILNRSKAVPSGQFFMFVTDSAHMIRAKKARAKDALYLVRKTEGSRLRLNPSVCRTRPIPGKGQIPHQDLPKKNQLITMLTHHTPQAKKSEMLREWSWGPKRPMMIIALKAISPKVRR
jgi:hypothetical protein